MDELYQLITEDKSLIKEDIDVLLYIINQIERGMAILISCGETSLGEIYEDVLKLKINDATREAYIDEEGKNVFEIFHRIQVPNGPTYNSKSIAKDMSVIYNNMKDCIPFYKRLMETSISSR